MDIIPLAVREVEIRPGAVHLFCPRGCKAARLAKRVAHPVIDVRTTQPPDVGFAMIFEERAGAQWTDTRLEPRYTNDPDPRYAPGTWWRRGDSDPPRSRGRLVRKIYKQGYVYSNYGFQYRKKDYKPPERDMETVREHTVERYDHERPLLSPGEHVVICYRCGLPAKVCA